MIPSGLSIRETARLFAVSRPTLAKWISTGKISAVKTENGEWLINPSEIIRLGIAGRPEAAPQVDNLPRPNMANLSMIAGQKVDNTAQQIEVLRAQLADAEKRAAVAEAQAAERADRIEDLVRRLDRAEARADLLLTDQRGTPDQAQDASRPSLWKRLTGRG